VIAGHLLHSIGEVANATSHFPVCH